jgi:trans-aconitate methyltransferase
MRTGHVLAEIAADWPLHKIDAVDICPAMLALAAKKTPQAHFIEADLAHHDLGTGRYDTVLSLNVLHHLSDPAAHLRALVAATALGGTLFLCDHAVEGFSMTLSERHWRRFKPSHARAFSCAELTAMLHALPVTITDSALLRPDIFWRLQIYQLVKKG